MDFLKKLFFGEKKEEPPQEIEESSKRNSKDICEICQTPIGEYRYKRVGGHIFHKRCFKNKQKVMLNGQNVI